MAHRILQQITSNVSKSPVIKGHIKLRSLSPQNDTTISRNLNFVSLTSMAPRPNMNQQLSSSTPGLLHSSYNNNFNQIRKKSKYIKDDNNIEADEDLQDELSNREVQDNKSKLIHEDYLIKFKKSLDDSDYPKQTAKEFALNKRLQSLSSRTPGQKLNEEIVNLSRTRSENRRLNCRLGFEEVEEQADITYRTALRKMHKVGQKINMNPYKINITSNPKLVGRRSNLKSTKTERYFYMNKLLQPSNLKPFGSISPEISPKQHKDFTIVRKPKEDPLIDDAEEPWDNIQRTNEKHSNYNQYNTFERQKESDEFTDQMKMLEPNYEPQKRYRSFNKCFAYEKNLPVEDTNCKVTTQEVKSDLKACQSIINHLKGLAPDYVRPPIDKRGTNEAALVQSTMNLISDYKNTVLSSRIDTLYHKIKARHEKNRIQKSTAIKSAANKPIKVRVGSKFDLQQCSFPSPNNQSEYIKSTTNEKVLVPWPSFSDRRKFSSPYTDIHQNISVLHIPMETKVPKSNKLEWNGKINKPPVDVFLPMKRPYSTKTKIEDVVPAEDFEHIATTSVANTPNFVFNHNKYTKSTRNINKTVDAVSNAEAVKKASKPSKQPKSKILQKSSTTKPQLDIGSNIVNKQDITSMKKPKVNFDTRSKISEGGTTKIPRLKVPNLTVQNPDCVVKKPEQKNYVHQVGNYSIIKKLNFSDPIPIDVKVEKETNASMTSCNTKCDLDKSFVSNSQRKLIESKRNDLEDYKTSFNSSPTTVKYLFADINTVSNKKISEPEETETCNTKKTIKKYCNASDLSSVRNIGKPECSARVIKKDLASLQQSADICIIGNQNVSKKVSINNLNNACSGAVLNKIDTTERSSTKSYDFDMKMDTCVLQGTQRNNKNKLYPLQRADSVTLSAAKEPTVKLMKTPQLSLNENVILKNATGKLKVNNIIKAKDLETKDESLKSNIENKKYECTNKGNIVKKYAGRGFNCGTNEDKESYAELRSSDAQNKSSINSNKLVSSVYNNFLNNTSRRKFSMHSAFSIMEDIAVVKNNFIPSIRTYCTENCNPDHEYTKQVRMKRLKKRPDFNDDFPSSSNWLLIKECQTLCEQMQNPKMDDLIVKKGSKRKELPKLKESNCPCIEQNGATKSVKLTRGPKKRQGYVVLEDNRNCIKESICDESEATRADNIAKYQIKKKKLPILLPKTRCFSTFLNKKCSSTTPSKKTIPLWKKQSKKKVAVSKTNSSNNIKMHSTIYNNSSRNLNKRPISPYVSYSEHRLSKINADNELYELHGTPEYLQPNCCIIGPTFDLDPPPLNHLTNVLRYGENFMKIPKSSIKELNRHALATATASQQNIIQKRELESIYKIDAKEESSEATKHIESYAEVVQFETIPQNTENIVEAPIIEDLNNSIEEKNIPQYNLNNVKEQMIEQPQSSEIELKSNKSETDIHFGMAMSSKQLEDHENDSKNSTVPDDTSIIFSNTSLIADSNMKDTASLWDRIISYLKSKLDDFAEIQEEKSKPDLLLCSGVSDRVESSNISEDNRRLKNVPSKNIACINSLKDLTNNQDNENDVPEKQERQTKTSSYRNFCKEYDALIQNLKEREDTLKAKYNNESATKLKSNIEHSKQIFKQNNLSPLTIQTRSYSNRCPKTTHNLIEYIKKIEQEKTANIDEDELEGKILNAIKVGIEVMKKSKLSNATDVSNAEIFDQLDPISKAELQTINSSMGDIKDSYWWPSRKTGVLKEGNNEAANSVQQFCCTGENHDYSVLEYEESERRKTEDLQKVLDEILKSNA